MKNPRGKRNKMTKWKKRQKISSSSMYKMGRQQQQTHQQRLDDEKEATRGCAGGQQQSQSRRRQQPRKRPQQHLYTKFRVQCTPKVFDPREMKTILDFSLRSLWGDLEPYSYKTEVSVVAEDDDNYAASNKKKTACRKSSGSNNTSSTTTTTTDPKSSILIIKCLKSSLDAIRAALTLPTFPPYFDETVVYRFDTILDDDKNDSDND